MLLKTVRLTTIFNGSKWKISSHSGITWSGVPARTSASKEGGLLHSTSIRKKKCREASAIRNIFTFVIIKRGSQNLNPLAKITNIYIYIYKFIIMK